MKKLGSNVILNYCGTGSTALAYLVLVPVYIHTIGISAYGILSLLMSIELTLRFLDFGLTLGITREVALHAADRQRLSPVLGLGGICYTAVALISWLALCALGYGAPRIWPALAAADVIHPFLLFAGYGVIIAGRWIIAYLYAVLRGFEHHNLVNVAMVIGNVGRVALVSSGLMFVRPELGLALLALIAASLIEMTIALFCYFREMRRRKLRLVFSDWSLFREIASFSGYVTVTSAAGGLLKNLDKFLLSSLGGFVALGAYQAAWTAAQMISTLVNPIALASYPRFSRLMAPEQETELSHSYHLATVITAVITAPVAIGGAVFSHDILLIVTGKIAVADQAAMAMKLLFLASLPNAVMQMSYLLQVSSGRPWISSAYNVISLILLLPVYYFGIRFFGITGAALGWLAFNIVYFAVMPAITHAFLLRGEKWRWVVVSCGRPALLAVLSFAPAFAVVNFLHLSLAADIALGLASGLAYAGLAVTFIPHVHRPVVSARMLIAGKRAE